MATTIDRQKLNTDPTELVKSEIELARNEHRPISRRTLADLITLRTGMPSAQAWLLVDAYCSEHETAIPEYTSSEFNTHWPKVTGVLLALAGIAVFVWGVKTGEGLRGAWPQFTGSVILFGLGVLLFVHSLESYQQLKSQRRNGH